MNYKFSKQSIDRMIGVDNKLVTVAKTALSMGYVDFGVAYMGGVRSAIDQRNLYNKGFSKLDGTHGISEHQKGLAIDLIPYYEGKFQLGDINSYYKIAAAMYKSALLNNCRIVWGGDWKNFRDFAHWELK